MVVVNKKRRRSIMTLAQQIYEDQRDYDTPPAEMADVTELLLMMAKKIAQLEVRLKELQAGEDK